MVNHDAARPVRLELLRMLERAGRSYVSGAALGVHLDVSRTSVWKHVRALRARGYRIEARARKGYRLLSCPGSLAPLEVQKRLHTAVVGREVRCLEEAASTQDVAFKLAQKGIAEGAVIVAEEQTGGRGRVGRSFFSPRGGLWFSVVLRPPVQPQLCLPVSLMAGAAVSGAIRAVTGLPSVLKWPNDVLVRGRKVAGILAEIVAETDTVRFLVCGIGVNANIEPASFPPEIRDVATSLSAELGRPVSRLELLCSVLEELDRRYHEFLREGPAAIVRGWRREPNVLGSRVKVTSGADRVEGIAIGLDPQGALLIEADGGVKRIVVGDVTLQTQSNG